MNYHDKEIYPAFTEEAQEWREETVFDEDFRIAERFGIAAVKDTFNRAFESWRKNAKYLVELCVVMNHRCWNWNGINQQLCKLYADFYHKCNHEIFKDEDNAFTPEERQMMFNVLD